MYRLLFALALGSFACGGKVVFVEDDGAGGATGSTTAGSPTGSSGSSGTDVASSSGETTSTGFIAPCQRLCMEHPDCLGGDCLAECEALYQPGCETETTEFVLCLAHNFGPACELGNTCNGEFAVYQNCFAPTIDCVETRCSEGPEACACEASCDGTMVLQSCQEHDDFFQCACSVDGRSIGECVQSDKVCELDLGCCKELWLLLQG
jgi:hypothetical protein